VEGKAQINAFLGDRWGSILAVRSRDGLILRGLRGSADLLRRGEGGGFLSVFSSDKEIGQEVGVLSGLNGAYLEACEPGYIDGWHRISESEIGDRQKAPTDPIQACPLGDVGREPE
jgi:hypothetical protein